MESSLAPQNPKCGEATKQTEKPDLGPDVWMEFVRLLTTKGPHLTSFHNLQETVSKSQLDCAETKEVLVSQILNHLAQVYQDLFAKETFAAKLSEDDVRKLVKENATTYKRLVKIYKNVVLLQKELAMSEKAPEKMIYLGKVGSAVVDSGKQLQLAQQSQQKTLLNEKSGPWNKPLSRILEETKTYQPQKPQINITSAESDKLFIQLLPKSEYTWQLMMKIDNYPRLEIKISKNQTIKYIKDYLQKKWLKKFHSNYRLQLFPNPEFRHPDLDKAAAGCPGQTELQNLPLSENYMLLDILAAYRNNSLTHLKFSYDIVDAAAGGARNASMPQSKEAQFLLGQSPQINLNQINQTQVQFFLQHQTNSNRPFGNDNSNNASSNYSFQKAGNPSQANNTMNPSTVAGGGLASTGGVPTNNAASNPNSKSAHGSAKKKKLIAQKQLQQNAGLGVDGQRWPPLKQEIKIADNNLQMTDNFRCPFEDQQEKFESQKKLFIESRNQSQSEADIKVIRPKQIIPAPSPQNARQRGTETEAGLNNSASNNNNNSGGSSSNNRNNNNDPNLKNRVSAMPQPKNGSVGSQKNTQKKAVPHTDSSGKSQAGSDRKASAHKSASSKKNNQNGNIIIGSSSSNNNNQQMSTNVPNEGHSNLLSGVPENFNHTGTLADPHRQPGSGARNGAATHLTHNNSNNYFNLINQDLQEQTLQKNQFTDSINFSNLKCFNECNSANFSNISFMIQQFMQENSRPQFNIQPNLSSSYKDQDASQFKFQTPNNQVLKQQMPQLQQPQQQQKRVQLVNGSMNDQPINEKSISILLEETSQKNKAQIEEFVSKIGESSSFVNHINGAPQAIMNVTDKIKRQSSLKK